MVELDKIRSTVSGSVTEGEGRWERLRFVSCPLNFLVYAISTTIDSPVLSSEDGSNGSLILDISRKPRDLWNENNNLDWW